MTFLYHLPSGALTECRYGNFCVGWGGWPVVHGPIRPMCPQGSWGLGFSGHALAIGLMAHGAHGPLQLTGLRSHSPRSHWPWGSQLKLMGQRGPNGGSFWKSAPWPRMTKSDMKRYQDLLKSGGGGPRGRFDKLSDIKM